MTIEEINELPAGSDADIALHQALGLNKTEKNVEPYSANLKAAFRGLELFMTMHPFLIYSVSSTEHPADYRRKPERYCEIVGNFGDAHNPGAYIHAEAAADTIPLAITRAILKALAVEPIVLNQIDLESFDVCEHCKATDGRHYSDCDQVIRQ
jgi:hypothetical protein